MKVPILEVKKLCKYYGENHAIDEVSFELYAGQCLALLGPNGSGKTSTLECIEGLREKTGGEILVNGKDIDSKDKFFRNMLGIQLQAAALPQEMTVLEAMELSCTYHGVDIRRDLLERFGLTPYERKGFSKLSVGQQRKLMLAIAISHEPKILILDEPTAGLDVVSRNELHLIIEELKAQDTAILLASHDMAEVERIADHIAFISKGKIIKEGSPVDFTGEVGEEFKVSIKTIHNCLMKYETLEGAVDEIEFKENYTFIKAMDIEVLLQSIMQVIKDENDSILDMRIERPSLEEEFIKIISEE